MGTQIPEDDGKTLAAGEIDFDIMFDRYYPLVYNYAYGRLLSRAAAEDVTSVVFLNALQNLWRFDAEHGKLREWILSIAHSVARDYAQMTYIRRKVRGAQEASFEGPAADDRFDDPKNRNAREVLAELSENERELLAMRYAMNMTDSEIARAMDISENAASGRCSRLIEKCRKIAMGEQSKK